jgi:hypothetical protein
MERVVAAVILGGLALVPLSVAHAQSEQLGSSASVLKTSDPAAASVDLPPAPRGKSTIFGGEIRGIDPVRDQLVLKVYGEKPMKILFDERSLVYLDGKRIRLRELRPEDHAAIETTLDGTNIFAVSIHALSRSPEGDYQGRVMSYDPGSGALTITSSASREPFTVRVPRDASFTREGQPSFASAPSGPSDLRKGSLVAVDFEPDREGHGVANKITVLAVPGAAFAFSGNISTLDMHTGSLVLIDPRDQRSYQISFDSAHVPVGKDLHLGEHVSVKADYDGAHYVANQITAD